MGEYRRPLLLLSSLVLLLLSFLPLAAAASPPVRATNEYIVGGLGISQEDVYLTTFNLTFGDYLTRTAGVALGKTFR